MNNKYMNNTQPLVSIIIPSYNHQDYIEKTLDSILEESYPNKEIVIIDDQSPDESDKVITDWIKLHNKKIDINYERRENRGLNTTLNNLITKAKGKYIVMLASDDYLLLDGIEKRVRFLENNSQYLAVFGDCIIVDNTNKTSHDSALFEYRNYKKDSFKNSQIIKKTFINKFMLPGPILMVKKELYETIGKYDKNLVIEDLDFYLKVASLEKIAFLNEKVSAYRIHNLNLSLEGSSIGYLNLLKDSRKIYIKQFFNFSFKYKLLIIWQIIKFTIRINLLKFRLSTRRLFGK